ncbi:putative nucleic acid-binding protein [Streptomyces sp. 846.5]|nr:PIN domain-containing protein [Streptomyces sp. 846.5]TDU03704.1 putative nucleic acid-binding protein [Streptomyces sp. 846.5]
MARVFVDTNVLFPFSIMDMMLSLAEDFVHDFMWSDRLLAEWQRVIVREEHRSPEAARRITDHIRLGFADTCVTEDQYKHLFAELDGPDPDDVHHMAAAVAARAEALITWNLSDFPTALLGPHGITVTPPDPYLCALLDQQPDEVLTTLQRMAAGKRRPPMTAMDVTDALYRAGVPAFAHRARGLFADRRKLY